jgi:hypothetical protein
MFFKYQPGKRLEESRPGRVFARIDSIEPGDAATEEPATVSLDCIDAEWLGLSGETPLWQRDDEEADRRISIIEASGRIFGVDKAEEGEGDWYHLELGDPDKGERVLQYFNLFSDPTARGVISKRKLTDDEQKLVEQTTGWKGIVESDKDDLEAAIEKIPPVDGVAIYDVGQGSCNALLSRGVPVLYFDFGGSATGNWRSFPLHLRQFCFAARPPIVLSHWDWDHWSSALRDLHALKATWILPIQSGAGELGGVHSRFLAMLRRNSARLLWWGHLGRMRFPFSGPDCPLWEVVRCAGPASSRNESGLGLILGHRPIRALLPGDASPQHVVRCGCKVDHLVVPHHGGRTNLTPLPAPTNIDSSHLIYSYGVGNIFLHPLTDMRRQIRGKDWKKNVHTALRDHTGFGHVGIDLQGHYNGASPPCGGACQLKIAQWIEPGESAPVPGRNRLRFPWKACGLRRLAALIK